MAVMVKKKKRKLKSWFKRLIYFFFLLLIILTIYLLHSEKIINLPKIYKESKTLVIGLFKKNKPSVTLPLTQAEKFTELFKNRLPSQNLEYATSSIDEAGNLKIYLKNTANEEGYLYVNNKDDANYVWITFISVMAAEPLASELKTNLLGLDYIDLRFSNKVFYKFKDTNLNVVISNSDLKTNSNSSKGKALPPSSDSNNSSSTSSEAN